MNSEHLHLMFTHFPIIGLFIGILINIYVLFKKSEELQKFLLWYYIVLGVISMITGGTGHLAEELIKNEIGVNMYMIKSHMYMAAFFVLGQMIMAGAALVGLYLAKKKDLLLKKITIYLFVFSLLLSILAIKTGNTGGAIRHTELTEQVK